MKKSVKKRGQNGGKRPGAGAKRSRLPEEMLAELGNPPDDILERNDWYGRALDIVQLGVLRGLPWQIMLRDLQRSSMVASKLVSEAIKAKLAKYAQIEKEDLAESGASATVRKDDPIAERTGAIRRPPN